METSRKIDREFLHDISNPMSALKVYLELLIENAKKNPNDESLQGLEKCQKLLDKCVQKIQAKKEELREEKSNG